MFFVFIALTTIAVILMAANPRDENTRWAAATAFAGGAGGLSRTVLETIQPYVAQHHLSSPLLDLTLEVAHAASSFTAQNLLPYAYLMYTICYCGFFSKGFRRGAMYALLAPVLFMLYVTPFRPVIEHNFKLLLIWVGPYIVAGTFLLVFSYIKEKNTLMKKNRLYNNLVAGIPLMFVLFSNYIARSFEINDAFRFNAVIIAVQFVGFIAFAAKYGVLGIKLKFEKHSIDHTLRAITTSSAMLNHTIKNRMSYIDLLADRMKHHASAIGHEELVRDSEAVLAETQHILGMVRRIQRQIEDIHVSKAPQLLSAMLDSSLAYVREQGVEPLVAGAEGFVLICDKLHMQEVFHNLFKNALEAMEGQAKKTLRIKVYRVKKQLVIDVADSGTGIKKEDIASVFDPFFSTKKRDKNFGLGLSYCYLVIQKHGGKLDVQSDSQGTTFSIQLPAGAVTAADTSAGQPLPLEVKGGKELASADSGSYL